ncbi:MAG: hypothetical protein ACK4ND_02455 [Cytophagaceae bacterium]
MEREDMKRPFCKVRIMAESPSASEFGREMSGRVLGREQIEPKEGYLKDLYPNEKRLTVILVEDSNGGKYHIPEKDIERIVC